MRYVTPILFMCVAGYVWWTASQDPSHVLVFPFLDSIDPSLRTDPQRWSRLSAMLFATIGGLLLLNAIRRTIRDRQDGA